MKAGHWYTYILLCRDSSLYTGITNNLKKRLEAHNKGNSGARYTRVRRPVSLVYKECYSSRSEAAKREYRIKQMSVAEKQNLIDIQAATSGGCTE